MFVDRNEHLFYFKNLFLRIFKLKLRSKTRNSSVPPLNLSHKKVQNLNPWVHNSLRLLQTFSNNNSQQSSSKSSFFVLGCDMMGLINNIIKTCSKKDFLQF